MPEQSLKAENAKTLRLFLAANFGVFLTIVASTGVGDLATSTLTTAARTLGPWAVLGPLAVTVLLGVVPKQLLEALIFHRLRDRLPGYRAFSVHAKTDDRVDLDGLAARIGDVPTDPKQQNQKWYVLSLKHRDDPGVRDSHRLYLLTRDATALSLLSAIILGGIIVLVVRPPHVVSWVYCLVLVLQVLLLAVAARNYAERLVSNVLAIASAA